VKIVKQLNKHRERGATLVEYVLLLTLIVLIATASIKFVGQGISSEFSYIGSRFENE
jgi:Flp pilus assembly pilin Flp